MRVLGIDTSLRSTGLGVVESAGSSIRCVAHEVVRIPASRPLSGCLVEIQARIRALLAATRPDAAAIEGVFVAKNVRTTMILGQARGVAIAACAETGVPVHEYPPRRVKQALVGYGAAQKDQVGRMVERLLALPAAPPEDAADALAIAICHLHARTGYAALDEKPL